MIITLTFLAIAAFAALAHFAQPSDEHAAALERALDSRWIMAVVFAATAIVLWYTWGELNPSPYVHDEMAYVLQAQILARGQWALPSPPMPAFWEQPHVLVQPMLAAKYFPGHSLALVPGVLLGWPALMPLVLQGTAAVLLFVLVRRIVNGAVALLAWIIWLTTPIVLYFGSAYYSEATTAVCWLGGWYALLEWRASGKAKWLLTVAFFTGWCILTRPLTGVAYAIPVGVVVLRDVSRHRRWRDLALAMALGFSVLGIIPIWSRYTTGNWRVTPLLLYTRQYMPYDLPGFGLISTPPELALSPQLEHLNMLYRGWHPVHVPAALPSTLAKRMRRITESVWGWSSRSLMVFAAIGLVTLEGATAFALASAVCLLLAYLYFATPPSWTLYYYEAVPVCAYLTATGIAWAIALLGRARGVQWSPEFAWRSKRWLAPTAGSALVLIVPGLVVMTMIRREHGRTRARYLYLEPLRRTLAAERRTLLFVHYDNQHDPNVSYVKNVLDPNAEPVWVVLDRGPDENAKLMALAPDRVALIYDETRNAVFRYDPRLVKLSSR